MVAARTPTVAASENQVMLCGYVTLGANINGRYMILGTYPKKILVMNDKHISDKVIIERHI